MKGEKGDPGDPGQDAVCDSRLCTAGERTREQPSRGGRRRRQKYSAFSVSRYGTEEAVDSAEIITWDHEFTNFGGDFSSDTGIFNCSIPGKSDFFLKRGFRGQRRITAGKHLYSSHLIKNCLSSADYD